MDTIFTDSQFRKFMDRHRGESGMIRQPLIIQMSALPIELPALCPAQRILACLPASNRVIISYPLISTHSI